MILVIGDFYFILLFLRVSFYCVYYYNLFGGSVNGNSVFPNVFITMYYCVIVIKNVRKNIVTIDGAPKKVIGDVPPSIMLQTQHNAALLRV
jgi:hypothetical protein